MITKKITKKIGATILAAAMMFGAVGDVKNVYAADEQNENVTETVITYMIGQEMSGEIIDKEDTNIYSITTDESDSFYEFEIANTDEENYFEYGIYEDKEGTKKINGSIVNRKVTKSFNMGKANKNHTYYLRVWGKAACSYKFNVVKTIDDVSDIAEGAEVVAVGAEAEKTIQNKTDADWFSFTTDASDSFYEFTISCLDTENHIEYEIYEDKEGTKKVNGAYVNAKVTKSFNMGKANKNHTYYLKVWGDAGASYKFNVVKTLDDVADDTTGAQKLVLNENKKFSIQNELDADYFVFETTDYVNYTLKFSNTGTNEAMTIKIYSGKDCLDSQKICDYYVGAKQSVSDEKSKLKLKRFKTYYVKVTGKDGTYNLGVSATAPGSVKASKAGKKNVSIKWKKVSRATGYEIYRAQGKNGKYKKITTIKKAGTVKYTDKKGLKKGKTYCYKIRAYKKVKGKTYYSAFSSVKTVKVK